MSDGKWRTMNQAELDKREGEQTARNESLSQLLKRSFSTRSDVSTTSSFGPRIQASALRPATENLKVIGLGTCGSVFEIPGTESIYKKGGDETSIRQDYRLTNKVFDALRTVRGEIQKAFPFSTIPQSPSCKDFHVAQDQRFWTEDTKKMFPSGYRTQQPIFTATKILPLARIIREALIEHYFEEDEEVQQRSKKDEENEHCLVRLYFGERESADQQDQAYNSLRNFELRLNMMEDLDLEIEELATEMAIGLAVLHWEAKVDGMDVEFVLGSSSAAWEEFQSQETEEEIGFRRRDIHLWMLDFDKASEIELTEDSVLTKLVPAYLGNDPYFPRPDVDEELWQEFSAAYLKASEAILRAQEDEIRVLPKRFLDGVLEQIKRNEDWDAEERVVFEDD